MHRIVMIWGDWKYNQGWAETSYLREKDKILKTTYLQNFLYYKKINRNTI